MTIGIEVASNGGLAAVALRGELDIHAAPDLRTALTAVLDGGARRLVLDMSAVAFMDSSGLGVLVGVHRRLTREGGRLELVGVDGAVARILTVTGLARVFDVRDGDGVALV